MGVLELLLVILLLWLFGEFGRTGILTRPGGRHRGVVRRRQLVHILLVIVVILVILRLVR